MTESNQEKQLRARRKAQNHFVSPEQREAVLRNEIQKNRATITAKTDRLRALRLAREAAARASSEVTSELKRETKKPRAPRMKRIVYG